MLAVISLVLCWGILVYILVYKSEKVLVSKLVKVNRIPQTELVMVELFDFSAISCE